MQPELAADLLAATGVFRIALDPSGRVLAQRHLAGVRIPVGPGDLRVLDVGQELLGHHLRGKAAVTLPALRIEVAGPPPVTLAVPRGALPDRLAVRALDSAEPSVLNVSHSLLPP